jgi:long-chain fatty acid transport protein
MATGFYVPQQTAYGAGRANAGNVAMAARACTVFFNPAGMTRLTGAEILIGVNLVTPSDRFQNRGTTLNAPATADKPTNLLGGRGRNPGAPTPVASLFYVQPLGSRWWVGVGLSSPFGLRLEYDSDWFGRYDSIESELVTLDLAPTVAYRLSETLSVGAGLNLQYADMTLTSAIPNTLAPNPLLATADGRSKLTGNALSLGFNLGLLWNITPNTRLGAHYRSGINHAIDGKSSVSGLTGALAAANFRSSIDTQVRLPDIVAIGVAHQPTQRATLLAEAQWFGWSRFDELNVHYANGMPSVRLPQGYRDTYALSAGAEYRYNDAFTLRAGVQYDRTPTVDQFRNTGLPDANRIWTALGFSYRPRRRMEFTLSYQHVFFGHPRINNSRSFYEKFPFQGDVVTRARVDAAVDTLSFAFNYAL